jgi:tellurite resistance protein TerC
MGATLIAIGLALLFLPGPGLVVIAVGLALLSSEFVWARRWLARVREKIEQARGSGAANDPSRARDGAHGADP